MFVLGVPKVLSEGLNKFLEKKNSYRYPQPKVGKSQEFSDMGCLKIFWVEGQKTVGPYRVTLKVRSLGILKNN